MRVRSESTVTTSVAVGGVVLAVLVGVFAIGGARKALQDHRQRVEQSVRDISESDGPDPADGVDVLSNNPGASDGRVVATAVLSGRVLDGRFGVPVAGALIAIEPHGATTFTDSAGRFAFTGLNVPGSCTVIGIEIHKPGYRSTRINDRALMPGAQSSTITLYSGRSATVRPANRSCPS